MTVAVILLFAAAAQPVPFQQGEFWGYKDARGNVVIPARYSMAERFSSYGIAAICCDPGWAYIDGKGRVVVRPFLFDNAPDEFRDGLARFVEGGKFGFFDQRGRIVIPAKFDFADRFTNGRAVVCQGCQRMQDGEHWSVVGGTRFYIDKKGGVIKERPR